MSEMTKTAWEINACTGFANGERFEAASQVREYFTVANLHQMVGPAQFLGPDGEDLTPDPPTLERWASLVITERWHCRDDFDASA